MAFKTEHVALSSVDTTDDTYKITTNPDIQQLVASINDIGILNPPCLVKRQDNHYRIITGFRRITAVKSLAWSTIEAIIIAPKISRLVLAKRAISENTFQRPLNIIEQSRSIQLLSPFYTSTDDLAKAIASLQISCNRAMIEKLRAITKLSEKVQDSLLNNNISLPTALLFLNFDNNDTRSLIEMFNVLKLNLNIQREIMTLIMEIAAMEDVSLSDVLQHPDIQHILADSKMDTPLKTQKIRGFLKYRRFSEISHAEDKFKQRVKALELDAQTKLTPPKFFESTRYSITLSFSTIEELEIRRDMLNQIIKNPAMHEILQRD